MLVLIVDDDPDGGEMLGDLVEELGHRSRVVQTGQRALQLAAEAPDVAFVDLLLPDVHGLELATKLRAIAPTTTLVALTGLVGKQREAQAHAAGFHRYLTKPYRIEDIEAILADIATPPG
jgi:CheY-like chemotaxis protein